jgi:MFS family permease
VANYLANKFGRRPVYIAMLFLSGTFLFVILAFEKGVYYRNWPITMFGLAGNVFISMAFTILYVYTNELYSTGIR